MAQRDYRRFIILSTARTGSSLLVQALHSHPRIVCFREVLNGMLEFVDFSVEGYDNFSAKDRALRDSDPIKFVEERIFSSQPPEVAAVGFKLLYGQAWDFSIVLKHLQQDPALHVVHLKRRNMLRTLTSFKLARQTDVWFEDQRPASKFTPANLVRAVRHPAAAFRVLRRRTNAITAPGASAKVTISPTELFEFETSNQIRINNYDEAFSSHPRLELFYEDVIAHREDTLAATQDFLGVERAALTTTLQRQNPEPLRDLIENYEELRAAFAGLPEAAFFDE